jgi:Alpha/beta hydrolase family
VARQYLVGAATGPVARGSGISGHGRATSYGPEEDWSSPADWRWVAEYLQAQAVETVIPDLPSHRRRSAHRPDDVQQVEAAIRAAAPPVAVAGWSYGGMVIGDLADTGPIGHLIFVASIPEPTSADPQGEPWDLASDPHLLFPDEAAVVLDDAWWLNSEEVAAFPAEVIHHLREHRRRPVTRSALLAPPVAEAWRTVPLSRQIAARYESGCCHGSRSPSPSRRSPARSGWR